MATIFRELQDIQNPFLRSIIAGLGIGSMLTMASAFVIGVANLKEENVYRTSSIIILAGTVLGSMGGALAGETQQKYEQLATTNIEPIDNKIWRDWRSFIVIRKVKESQEITSFYLQPQDEEELPDFLPGQFLTIKLDIPEQSKPIIRTYSLSDYDLHQKYYRLSIKRELAPKDLDVPPGLSSNFMHDRVDVGSIIPAKPPNGRFFLDLEKANPIVLVSNGVGITPMIAMAKASIIQSPQRQVWFFHGARDGSFHALREEMANLAKINCNLHLHYAYSKPRPEDEGLYHSTGYIDTNLIHSFIKEEAEYFLCGSPPFMNSLRSGLQEIGIPTEKISFEMFTKEKKAATTEPTFQTFERVHPT